MDSSPDPYSVSSLATARFSPEVHNNKVIERPLLIERLTQQAHVQLILVEAPAGFGKTVVLDQWRRRWLQHGAVAAWLTLDEADTAAVELLDYIEQALRLAGLRGVNSPPDDPRQRISALLNAIAATAQPVVLLLDEFEQANAEAALTINRLLKHAPANLQLVIASRSRPALHIAGLRSRGLVFNLGVDELSLRSEEIAQLFDCKLARRELAVIVQTSQGWPAAVQLLKSAHARGISIALAQPSGQRDRVPSDVVDYVAEEVLATLTAEQRSLFREISVLDELFADAVAAMTGRPDAWRRILEVERLQPFLAKRKATESRRLHPLLHHVLAAEFASADSVRRGEVLRAAARWYAGHEQLARAISCALECDDIDLAGALIQDAGGVHIWIRHGKAVTMGIDALLTQRLMERFPRVRLLRALVQIKNGQLSDGRYSFEQVNRLASDDPLLTQHSLVVEATLLFNECRPASDSYLDSFERAMRDVASDDHVVRGSVCNLYCLACSQRGLFEKAVPAAHAAIENYRQAGSTHGQIFEHLHLGSIAFAQGMPVAAKSAYARSRELARRHFGDDQGKSALLNCLCAELAYEQNLLAQASRLTRQAEQHVLRVELWYDIYAAQFVTSAMLALERGGIAEARSALETARQAAAERRIVGVMRLLEVTSSSCLALAGEIDEAHETMASGGFDLAAYLESNEVRMWREQEAVLVAALRVAARKPVFAVPVAAVEAVLSRMWSGRQIRAAIRLGATLASFYWCLERPAQAVSHLDSVLRASQRSGYVRVFMEDRDYALPVLERWRETVGTTAEADVARHADVLLAALQRDVVMPVAQPSLTQREAEILQEIGRGRSDKEIARTLRLSENTVKFHLKNLYAKLQVGRRIDAVQQARRRGIVH